MSIDITQNLELLEIAPSINVWTTMVQIISKFKCQTCNSTIRLMSHHIHPRKKYQNEILIINNGIGLCSLCHGIAHGENIQKLMIHSISEDKILLINYINGEIERRKLEAHKEKRIYNKSHELRLMADIPTKIAYTTMTTKERFSGKCSHCYHELIFKKDVYVCGNKECDIYNHADFDFKFISLTYPQIFAQMAGENNEN